MTMDVANTPSYAPVPVAYLEDRARPVLGHGRDLVAGAQIAPHSHPRGQLLWAVDGVLRVHAGDAVWIVPPEHAVWIPGGTEHHVMTETPVRARNLYVDPSIRPRGPGTDCEVLLLSPLLREIILRLAEGARPGSARDTAAEAAADPGRVARLAAVAVDEIAELVAAPLSLPGGHDPRLRRLTGHLGRVPGDRRALAELAGVAGASPRTLERLFRAETGLTFRQWRSRARVLAALEGLRAGRSSTQIAYDLGYRSPSAFIAAFHGHFGCAPQHFFATRGGEG